MKELTKHIDHAVLDGLRDLGPDLLPNVIALFLKDAPVRLAAMGQAIIENNSGSLEVNAHTLKGSSASLGAIHVAELCAGLERMGRSGDLGHAPGLFARLEVAFDQVRILFIGLSARSNSH